MSDQANNGGNEPDFMSMSDEDWQNFQMPSTVTTPEASNEAEGNDNNEGENNDDQAAADAEAERLRKEEEDAAKDNEGGNESEGETEEEKAARIQAELDAQDPVDEGEGAGNAAPDSKNKQAPAKEDGKAKSGDEGAKDESEAVDWNKVMSQPITANGRQLKIETPEDAVSLMQMGANYSKKMAAIKPNLKLLKMLESNGLLSEESIGFLIDVHKKDPAAISKLVADAKIDPLDITNEKATEYKPGNHRVSEQEMQLDAVLSDIKDSKHYADTLKLVSTDWDDASRQVVAAHPGVMKIIESHMANGAYALISEKIEQERMFGRLQGVSDIEAYKQVSDAIEQRGGFAHLQGQKAPAKAAPAKVVVEQKSSKADEDAQREKKRAAGATRTGTQSKALPEDFNIMGMSDDDFAKFKFK